MQATLGQASAVIAQAVPADAADWFLDWQRGTTAAAEAFLGYRGTEVYPPAEPGREWVVLVHFDDEASLRAWLDSPERAARLAVLGNRLGEFRLAESRGGFGLWFSRDAEPAEWKMALTVLVGLYPTVVLLMLTVGAVTSPLGVAVSLLIGNALSVALMQWVVMPALTRLLGPWLRSRAAGVAVVAGLASLLVLAALLFRQVTG